VPPRELRAGHHVVIAVLATTLSFVAFPLPPAFAQLWVDDRGVAPQVAQTAPAPESAPASAAAPSNFFSRFFRAYVDEFKDSAEDGPEPARRALPAPLDSPPFPSSEWQGFPLLGVPYGTKEYPLTKALYGTGSFGDFLKENRIKAYGWINASGNWSSADDSNLPTSYWIFPNQPVLNQAVFRVEREVDTVQKDHVEVGFRSTFLYGTDYRYMTAGGWTSGQLLKHNYMYGVDLTEQYVNVYVPQVAQGMIVTVGRWIATPDIETQFAPDNYLGTHSLLFTFDTYTQTGIMATLMLNKQWTIQGAVHAGTDMAPWYKGATPTGMLGVRWVSLDNDDAAYVVLNSINNARFQRFKEDGQAAGHDNFNYLVATWQHKFNAQIHTKTEGYFMWQRDAVVGGTPSIGPVRDFGGGGGIGKDLPGYSLTYGLVNYSMFAISKRDYFTVRNEVWRDERGERSGTASTYSSHTIGWTHQLSDVLALRPEVGYYHSYNHDAFDLGKANHLWLGGVDVVLRF
jgi:Putative beta-barrel porin-2, OmpL-like. bbp2